ncbi:hypothetical protein [Microvirga sp. TS319]|uniref:hypothetical protein n=1 Tax=Microvirga sp. TS319 TaxID=3241165 RepID=UPI00351A01C6
MQLETEEVQQKPKRLTLFGGFRFHQSVKHLIALVVTGLVAMCRFGEELGIPRIGSTSILTLLLLLAFIYRKKILEVHYTNKIPFQKSAIIIMTYIACLVCSAVGIYSGDILGDSAALLSKVMFWLLVSPMLYLITIDAFGDRD